MSYRLFSLPPLTFCLFLLSGQFNTLTSTPCSLAPVHISLSCGHTVAHITAYKTYLKKCLADRTNTHSHIRDSSLPCSAHRSIQSHSLNWKLNTPGSVTQSSGTLRIRTASLECCFMTQLRLAQRSIQLHPLSWLENALGLSTTICNWM